MPKMDASDDFSRWAQLAEGEERNQLAAIIEVARTLGTTPAEIVRIALELKRESKGRAGKPSLWINGVPYFNIPTIALIEGRLIQERMEATGKAIAKRN